LKLLIKHMVSARCKKVVQEELNKLRLPFISIDLGSVEMRERVTLAQRETLRTSLLSSGLELMDNKEEIITEKIKKTIIELISESDDTSKIDFSGQISARLKQDYHYLSQLFCKVSGQNIQQFIAASKVDRVKYLLLRNEFTLTEISYQLHYSSVAHLCAQFKKITGFTPSRFRQMNGETEASVEPLRSTPNRQLSLVFE